ncbi:MAG: dihydrodipicolinate synthase family protein [Anaerolineae bacterium]|nr:dihydrodipicolinate synthase family protein [Anaerolineae bacterium]MDW8098737.1 dihydrodipicolinate synthase family protein [Anaerolineae bacterium]
MAGIQAMRRALGGVFAPIVTPFRPDSGEVDLNWVERHLAFLRARGCDGVVPAGTTGEGPSLGFDERCRLVDCVVENAAGMAVIAGVGTPSLTDTAALIRYAFQAGVDGVLVLPPYYYRSVPAAGLIAYYRRLCDLALEPGQQIFLYHIPQVSGVPVTHELLDGLMETHAECVGGLKDSSRDPEALRAFVSRYPSLQVFCGSDSLADLAFSIGAAGTISVMANLIPDHIQALRRVAGTEAATPLQDHLSQARQTLAAYPIIAAIKYALHQLAGFPWTATRPPNVELSPEQQAALTQNLARLGLVEVL